MISFTMPVQPQELKKNNEDKPEQPNDDNTRYNKYITQNTE